MVCQTYCWVDCSEFKTQLQDLLLELVHMNLFLLYYIHCIGCQNCGKDRLVFKLLIIAYKCQHQLAPHYLQQLLQEYQPSRLLRSSTKQLLTPHNVVTKSYGQRSFQYSMPHLWNQLPDDIRECSSLDQFKSLLKSHLFVK